MPTWRWPPSRKEPPQVLQFLFFGFSIVIGDILARLDNIEKAIKRPRDDVGLASQTASSYQEIHAVFKVGKVDDKEMWRHVTRNKPEKKCAGFSTLPVRSMMTALRWQILKNLATTISLDPLQRLKKPDERSYYPFWLRILNASARGFPQGDLLFKSENFQLKNTREDFVLCHADRAIEPSESKLQIYCGQTPEQAIDKNAEALGHLVKCIRDHFPQERRKFHCTMSSRMNRVHIVELDMAENGDVTRCLVTPELPDHKTDESAPDSIVIEDSKLQLCLDAEKEHFLLDVLPELVPQGWLWNLIGSNTL